MRKLSLQKSGPASGKQPVCLQQTSGSGELTFLAAAFRLCWGIKNLTLLSYSNYIMGIPKPASLICKIHQFNG